MTRGAGALAWVLLITLSLIWGSSFILIKKGLLHLTPGEVGALRIVAASACLIPFALPKLKVIRRKDWKYLISVGFVGSLIPSFLFAVAQTQLQSSLTGVLNALTPISTILMAAFMFGQKYTGRVYGGIAIGFSGTAMLILGRADGSIEFNPYGLLIILATVFYALNLNFIKAYLQSYRSLVITSVSLALVGPVATVYLFTQTHFADKLFMGPEVWWSVGYILLLGVAGTAVALIIFNKLVQLTNPVFTASVTYIIPLVAVGWGLMDGEQLGMLHYFGMVGIVIGVYIANRPKRSKLKNELQDPVPD